MSLVFFLIFYLVLDRINFFLICKIQENLGLIFLFLFLFLIWIILIARELNRSPFDLAEGESEIVSGINTEFIGGLFSFLFIAEYGIMILLMIFRTVLFLGGGFLILKSFVLCVFLVWIRCSLPRIRYDLYIIACWKLFLPLILILLILEIML